MHFTPIPLLLIPLLLALPSSCNRSSCEELRDELTAQKAAWQSCERDTDCVIVGGNVKDCSGVMSCNFAVHREHRASAERRVASLPEESVDCFECTSPNCVEGRIAVCEPVRSECIIVTELIPSDANTSPAPSGSTSSRSLVAGRPGTGSETGASGGSGGGGDSGAL